MQSFVTEKGEQGAMPTRIIEYLQRGRQDRHERQGAGGRQGVEPRPGLQLARQ